MTPPRTEFGDERETSTTVVATGASGIVKTLGLCLGLVVVAAGLGFGYVYWLEPRLKARPAPVRVAAGTGTAAAPARPSHFSTPFIWKGVESPPVVPAAKAMLADDEPVFGIEANGKHRAYVVREMRQMTTHIVNDFVNGMPVTVTYCDIRDCVRGFTAEAVRQPLRINQGGWMAGRLILYVGNGFYFQDTGIPISDSFAPLPFTKVEVVRATWKEWREAHPDTEVAESLHPPMDK